MVKVKSGPPETDGVKDGDGAAFWAAPVRTL